MGAALGARICVSHAAPLPESAIYVRCHAQFARRHPSPDDPLLLQVKSGKIRAADACMRLLDESDLDPRGMPRQGVRAGALNPDARPFEILRTFQAFHMSWFPIKDFVRIETEAPTTNLYDANEMGYHLTYNLFGRGTRFSEIVTRPHSFRGIRFRAHEATSLLDSEGEGSYAALDARKWGYGDGDKVDGTWTPRLVEFGKLIGIAPMKSGENPVSFKDPIYGHRIRFEATKSLGAGILGTISYLLLTGPQEFVTSTGGSKMYRTWSKAVFSDLLCRGLPVLRNDDVRGLARPNSSVSFRGSDSCMRCHATIDPLAATIRNVISAQTDGSSPKFFSPRILPVHQVDMPAEATEPDMDLEYFRRPPRGLLRYRNYRGELVNRPITGVQGVGQALAETDDLYVCTAKRYFEFMTGIDVQVDEAGPAPSRFRDFVVHQGLELKKNQSLKGLIEGILKSDFYSLSDYGAEP